MMNTKTELKQIAENLEFHERLTLRIMTAMIDEEISYSDFERNMLNLASHLDDEVIGLQAIIARLPDDVKEGK
jgi:hypothetical protein